MRYEKIVGFMVFMVILIAMAQSLISSAQGGFDYLFIYIVPAGNIDTFRNVNISILSTSLLRLEKTIDTTPDYYILWLLTGLKPRQLDINILASIGLVNQDRVIEAWGNATLTDIPVVDPRRHPFSINPVQYFDEISLPPEIITMPINGSGYTETLKTRIVNTLREYTLDILLLDYNVSIRFDNIKASRSAGPARVAINETGTQWYYNVLLYLVDYNETHITLAFPGAIRSTGYMSGPISEIVGATLHWYMLIKYKDTYERLGSHFLSWVLNWTVDTSVSFATEVFTRTNKTVNIAYLPHVSIARSILSEEEARVVEYYLYDKLVFYLGTKGRVDKPNYLALLLFLGDENSAVFLSGQPVSRAELDVEMTIDEFIASLLTLSDLTPLATRIDPYLRERLKSLEVENFRLNTMIAELNTKINKTEDELAKCRSSLDLAEAKVSNIEAIVEENRELVRTLQQYVLMIIAISIAVSGLLGFLLSRVLAKKSK